MVRETNQKTKEKVTDKPLVSICIPNYNSAEFIEDAIQSCLDQTYKNLEIIVVDNCSSDESWQVIQKFSIHEKLRVFRNKGNLGMVNNFKKSFEYTKGEYVTFLCSDDFLEKESIQDGVELLKSHPQANFVFGNIDFLGSRVGNTRYSFSLYMVSGEWTKESLKLGKNITFLTGSIFRRSSLDSIRGPIVADLVFFDWFLWLRLGIGSVVFNNKTVGAHRYHVSNQTKQLTPGILKNFDHLDAVLLLFKRFYPEITEIDFGREKQKYNFARLLIGENQLGAASQFVVANCKYPLATLVELILIYCYTISRRFGSRMIEMLSIVKFK